MKIILFKTKKSDYIKNGTDLRFKTDLYELRSGMMRELYLIDKENIFIIDECKYMSILNILKRNKKEDLEFLRKHLDKIIK